MPTKLHKYASQILLFDWNTSPVDWTSVRIGVNTKQVYGVVAVRMRLYRATFKGEETIRNYEQSG